MIYSEKTVPTECLASIKVDTSEEISIEELRRMLNELREAVMNNKPILLLRSEEREDAEPVRHGRWIEVDVGDCCYRCSECGFIRDAYLLDIGNYCPKCGAKMDREKENADKIL